MKASLTTPLIAAMVLALAACSPSSEPATSSEADAAAQPSVDAVEAAEPVASDEMPTRLRAHGNEPFWNVEVDGSTLTYTRMGEDTPVVLQAQRSANAHGVEFSGEHDGAPFNLNIGGDACPNTMSDETHEFTATFDFKGENLRGCADRAESE